MNVSVPPYRHTPPRALTPDEHRTALAVATALIPAGSAGLVASQLPDYERWLSRALAARADAFHAITRVLADFDGLDGAQLTTALRERHEEPEIQAVCSVIAGAYLMSQGVRERIHYPGQHPNPPPFDEAADQIMDGILDPVVARGSIYTAAPI
jgi:hypothetical protein